jgi:hypothetical protein
LPLKTALEIIGDTMNIFKKIIITAIGIFAFMFLAACSESDRDLTASNAPSEKQTTVIDSDVEIEISVSETSNRQIKVAGHTNLPDGTEFLISLDNQAVGFGAQDKAIVKNGKFSSVPMGPEAGLKDGEYLIEVLMPLPFTQSEKVQRIIGDKGEYLTGPLVEVSEFGGNIASTNSTYSLGSKESIKQNAANHNQLVQAVTDEAVRLLDEGRKMENLRHTDDASLLRKCGLAMRKNQSSANALQHKKKPLSIRYIRLTSAVNELSMCVSCSSTAMEACDRAAAKIAEQNEI